MVKHTWSLEHVILLLKSIKAGLRPALRIALATIWQKERLLPQASWACPSSLGTDSNLAPTPPPPTPVKSRAPLSPHYWGASPAQTQHFHTLVPCILASLFLKHQTKPKQTNQQTKTHYFSMLHSTGWVIKTSSHFRTFPQRNGFHADCMLVFPTASAAACREPPGTVGQKRLKVKFSLWFCH